MSRFFQGILTRCASKKGRKKGRAHLSFERRFLNSMIRTGLHFGYTTYYSDDVRKLNRRAERAISTALVDRVQNIATSVDVFYLMCSRKRRRVKGRAHVVGHPQRGSPLFQYDSILGYRQLLR
jgi:hypothetical protein